jgi:hypothetical protein
VAQVARRGKTIIDLLKQEARFKRAAAALLGSESYREGRADRSRRAVNALPGPETGAAAQALAVEKDLSRSGLSIGYSRENAFDGFLEIRKISGSR